ncbi:conserved hypothetical protein [Candidatus Sulfopaludibacter sp. SbA3]|nr:conserved hypothetical protein [Candidatus Sulfopaludibacter sp. SbA3]
MAAMVGTIAAQPQPAGAPAFEVASVKPAEGGGPPGDMPHNMDPSPGHLAMRNVPLRYAIEWAFDLKDYQISGPEWIKVDERYDIVAKAAGPATDDQMKPMLQALLLQRFQMKVHKETKDLPVYALVLGKGPPKVKEVPADGQPGLRGDPNGVTFHQFGLWRLAFLLTRRMDRPVLDLTGLKGVYDYSIDISGLGRPGDDNPPGPSIFSAVQQDLGMKLEARKEPVEVLFIDHVEKVPTAN